MSEGNNQWRCEYCDGLNRWEDEVCQICGDGRRPESSGPQMPKTYTPRERTEEASTPEAAPAPESDRHATEPEKPKKKRHGLLWTLVIMALAYGGGKLLGGQLSLSMLSPAATPTPEPWTPPAVEVPIEAPTAVPIPEPTEAPTPEPTAVPTPEPTQVPTPEPAVLKRGNSGDEVAALQAVLIEHHYLEDKADGQFGGKTEAAVKKVQAEAGYQQTGVADVPTQAYLQDHYAPFNPTEGHNILMYRARFDVFGNLNIYFKNTGQHDIASVLVRLDQCNESKSALGSFFNKRNSRSHTWWSEHSHDLTLPSGSTAIFDFDLEEGRHYTFGDGSDNVVTYFDDGRFVRVTLLRYTTVSGHEHTVNQVVYCRFR